jgi:hypothetical protein
MSNRMKKPRVASLPEVTITREGETAVIAFTDDSAPTMHLTIGPKLSLMSDADALCAYNHVVQAMQESAANYQHIAVEVPEGRPQLTYHADADQWVPRGQVLRCVIDSEDRQPLILIDEHSLTWEEFGQLLLSHEGWGMRVIFVPDDEIAKTPTIVIRDQVTPAVG